MEKTMNKLIMGLLLAVMSCSPAYAKGFGTSYGGSRSYSRPSTSYSRPAPVVHQNVTVNRTTVVHQNTGGGGGSGLLTGMVLGHMLSQPAQAPVVIAQPAPVVVQQVEPAPVQQPVQAQFIPVEKAPEESCHWFLWLLVFGISFFGIYAFVNKENK